MSVLAWDGVSLAADKQISNCGQRRTGTKIFRVHGMLAGITGGLAFGMAMLDWLRAGAVVADFPKVPTDEDDRAYLLVIEPGGGILTYDYAPYAVRTEDRFIAMGSGRDYATAAMALGRSAAQAVELACRFEIGCGMGVDVLLLHPLTAGRVPALTLPGEW